MKEKVKGWGCSGNANMQPVPPLSTLERKMAFDEFTAGINECLNRVETEYKGELETLMTPKFQNLKKYNYWRYKVYIDPVPTAKKLGWSREAC